MVRTIARVLVSAVVVMAVIALLFPTVYVPWERTWGATQEEIERAMPGDAVVSDPDFVATRALSVHAAPRDIWPWIVQIGYRRAGFYSYDRLDNDGIPSAEQILAEYQGLQVGDAIPLTSSVDARVSILEPGRFLLLTVGGQSDAHETWTWAWGLYPEGDHGSRLVTRLRARLDNRRERLLLDAFEIVMMRKHMLGIKERAERAAAASR